MYPDGYARQYGKPEPQKALAAEIGRTKRSRDPMRSSTYVNDGRPPAPRASRRKRKDSVSESESDETRHTKALKLASTENTRHEVAASEMSSVTSESEDENDRTITLNVSAAADVLVNADPIFDACNKIIINGTQKILSPPGVNAACYVGCPWRSNSCFFDTPIEILHVTHYTLLFVCSGSELINSKFGPPPCPLTWL
jgi:hypothetical protein